MRRFLVECILQDMIETALLEKKAMQLPEVDRALLADRLIQSLSRILSKLKNAWVEEANSRMNAYRAGDISTADVPPVVAKLRSRFVK